MAEGIDLLTLKKAKRYADNRTPAYSPVEDLVNMYDSISFPRGVGLVAIRFDDNDKTFYTNAFASMKNRALVGTLAFVANKVGVWPSRPKCTDEEIQEMCAWGFELASHSMTHGDGTPTDMPTMLNEVVESKRTWENDIKFYVRNFVRPGSWGDAYYRDSPLGQLIMQHYTFAEDYYTLEPGFRPNYQRYGVNHIGCDNLTLGEIQAHIDTVAGSNRAVILMFHGVGREDGLGVSAEDFDAVMAYIATLREAGTVENVTCSGLMAARVGDVQNKLFNGDFEVLDGGSFPVNFEITEGSPSVVENGGRTGNALSTTGTNKACFRLRNYGMRSPSYRITGWHKTTDTGRARFWAWAHYLDNTKKPQILVNSTSEWQKLELCVATPWDPVPPKPDGVLGSEAMKIELYPQGGGVVLWDDIQVVRIG